VRSDPTAVVTAVTHSLLSYYKCPPLTSYKVILQYFPSIKQEVSTVIPLRKGPAVLYKITLEIFNV
jgi:hypothetical protein